MRSGGLPELDPVTFGIGHPAEPADTVHLLRVFSHVRSLGTQLRDHGVQVADPEVEHGLLRTGPEVAGLGLERREYRRPGFLAPQAVLIGVQTQAIAIPRAQGRRRAASTRRFQAHVPCRYLASRAAEGRAGAAARTENRDARAGPPGA